MASGDGERGARAAGEEPIELVVVRGCTGDCTVEVTAEDAGGVDLGPVVRVSSLPGDALGSTPAWVGCGGTPSGSPCYKTPGFGTVVATEAVRATSVRVTRGALPAVDVVIDAWPALEDDAPPIERVDPGDVGFLGGPSPLKIALMVVAVGLVAAVLTRLLLTVFGSARGRRPIGGSRVPRPAAATVASLVAQAIVAVELFLTVLLGLWLLWVFVFGHPEDDPFLVLLIFAVPAMIATAIVAAAILVLVAVAAVGVAARWQWARVAATVVHGLLVVIALGLQVGGDADAGESVLGGAALAVPAGLAAVLLLTRSAREDFARAAAHRAAKRAMRAPQPTGTEPARAV
ncbi:MAG: hypothetical protein ACRD29_07305 [Acidimicrobiales bacterium]